MPKLNEIWKDIKNYENCYQISNLGRVKSVDRYVNTKWNKLRLSKGKVLKSALNKGYPTVVLTKPKIRKTYLVHRLVALHFIDNKDFSKSYINHIDGNKENNKVTNLEWCSRSENQIHAYKLGLQLKGEDHPRAKFTNNQIDKIREMKNKYTGAEISRKLGISETHVYRVIHTNKRS